MDKNKVLDSVNNSIKNITRSGTTFTATRNNDSTFTFTQQDNNTTYSNATTSAAGLMSASDKTKLNNQCSYASAGYKQQTCNAGATTFNVPLSKTMPNGNYIAVVSLCDNPSYYTDLYPTITNRTASNVTVYVWNGGGHSVTVRFFVLALLV